MDVALEPHVDGSARRRRERRLRAWFRHEQFAIRCALASAMHHSHMRVASAATQTDDDLRGDDVQGFDSRWDEVLLLTEDLQLDTLLERSDKMRIRESQHLNTVLAAPTKSRTEKKSVSVERKQGDCYQREANGKCTKGDACSSRYDDSKRGKSACSSSSTPKSPLKIDEKNLFARQASQRDSS